MTTYGISRAPCECPYCKTARELFEKAYPRPKKEEDKK